MMITKTRRRNVNLFSGVFIVVVAGCVHLFQFQSNTQQNLFYTTAIVRNRNLERLWATNGILRGFSVCLSLLCPEMKNLKNDVMLIVVFGSCIAALFQSHELSWRWWLLFVTVLVLKSCCNKRFIHIVTCKIHTRKLKRKINNNSTKVSVDF